MTFIRVQGIQGKVFVPDGDAQQPRKHSCKDCYCCQMCSDDRCHLCLRQQPGSAGIGPIDEVNV